MAALLLLEPAQAQTDSHSMKNRWTIKTHSLFINAGRTEVILGMNLRLTELCFI